MEQSIPFNARFKKPMPPGTNAQLAATRVRNVGGVLKRTDPHVGPLDRFGNAFNQTSYFEASQAPPQPQTQELSSTKPRSESPKRSSPADTIKRFREKVLITGGSAGIHSLGRVFRLMDTDDNRRLGPEELSIGLERYGLPLSSSKIQQLIDALDKDKSGTIRFDEFLLAIRGTINQRRQKMIDMAFKVLDKTGNGTITMEDIEGTYNAGHDPDVLAGRMPEDSALGYFLAQFDTIESDGIVSGKEFTEYYRNISASIDNDDYFELMIRNAWHIPGGVGWSANTSNVRLLVVSSTGEQRVVMIENDLGLDVHDRQAVLAALNAQGITDVYKFTLSGDI